MRSLCRGGRFAILCFLTLTALSIGVGIHFFPTSTALAAPTATVIPLSETTPLIDGVCEPKNEYADAQAFSFSDWGSFPGTVYLKQTASDLYVCMNGAVGRLNERFFSVYLDRNNGREGFAGPEDYGLRVAVANSANSTVQGTGSGNYTPLSGVTGWTAQATSVNSEQAEWRIPISLVSQTCGANFGLAVYHHWLTQTGDDYGWPSNQFYDRPDTWQEVSLAAPNCLPDLSITKQASAEVFSGTVLTYTISVQNNGVITATDVTVVDTLPGEVVFQSSDPTAPACTLSGAVGAPPRGGTLTCGVGSLGPGASSVVTVVVWPVSNTSTGGSIVNQAQVSSKEGDANPKDNATTTATIIKSVTVADLTVTKHSSASSVTLGSSYDITLTVTNLGNSDATGVTVTDTLPSGIAYDGFSAPPGVQCQANGNAVSCSIPQVLVSAAGGNQNAVIIVLHVHAVKAGKWRNSVSVAARTPIDPNLQNNSAGEDIEITGLHGLIAYVLRADTSIAGEFKTLLEAAGFTVQLVRCDAAGGTDFSVFDEILIGDDTGDLNTWCGDSAGAAHIASAGKPVIGLGEGGYAFFGKLGKGIGWPNGWHGPLDAVKPLATTLGYFHTPTDFGSPVPSPLTLYDVAINAVSIYTPTAPTSTPVFALEPVDQLHAPLIGEECNQLWGFSGGPNQMNGDGKNLFVNAVVYGLGRTCPPPPRPNECIILEKSAEPSSGAPVHPGDAITYHLTYKVLNNAACATQRAVLEDPVPVDTLFVPGSATDGVGPGGDGVLRWSLGALAPGTNGEKIFQVYVTDAQCNNQRRVNNQARLVSTLGVFTSNLVTHPVDCPPVVPAGTQPPYAEDEIQIYPYPIVAGRLTEVSVRVRNLLSTTQQVTVTFETSPQNFGIGINFAALPVPNNPRVITLPPFSTVEVHWTWTPSISGHFCVRIRIEGAGAPTLFTYRNLDVKENLRPGVEDTLPIAVGNPTATTANVLLVVDNTCPGWQAWINPAVPADPLVLTNMTPGEVRTATLHVIPPTDRPLGTSCHIDVQGWIGSQLIGGIRKLDVPPVHLPHSDPPWMEKEISVIPDTLTVGQTGQICVELQNPMPFTRTVTIGYAVADFGAGIGFTPVGTQTVTLPPNSIDRYCISWTPTASNNLHRCILITLHQEGFQDQTSQRNIDLQRRPALTLDQLLQLRIPFTVGNTASFTRTLEIRQTLLGLPPEIRLHILPDPPPFLGPGQMMDFTLGFQAMGVDAADLSQVQVGGLGDVVRAELGVYLDGKAESGFSVEFDVKSRIFLPLILTPQ